MALNALDRHLALVGFMGAGKTTLAQEVAARIGRRVVDADRLLEGRAQISIGAFFAQRGETEFRVAEASLARETFRQSPPAVVALGGGAVKTPEVQTTLRERALTVFVEIDVDTAWERSRETDRPLAQDEDVFRRLYDERQPLYRDVADAVADDADGIVLAAAGIHYELGALERLGDLVPGDGPVALVADSTVMGIYGPAAQTALGERLRSTHDLPPGEAAKRLHVVERLWSELRLDRTGTVVALGGGALTDTAGLAAAMYLRGVPWVAVPTTLVGQVDAGIGGKTAIDIPQGKNLVGAFHWPARVVLDEALLTTLPERERRQGEAELIKTELLAGHALDVRGAAAFKAALCLRDPHDRGVRRWLNLGHTFAHALEAAADYNLPHGDAVALGLLAALRVSGRDPGTVIARLDPKPVAVDRDRAWAALQRDKKRTGDAINLVLLGDDGPYVEARPADEVRAALDRLIAP
jgi:shikimate kinase/3-dehydroquinate synthase